MKAIAVPSVGTSAPPLLSYAHPDGVHGGPHPHHAIPCDEERATIDIQNSAPSTPDRYAPSPSTPTVIRSASAREQTRHTANTCDLSNPCLRTNMFWGPIASMRPMLRAKPSMPADHICFPRGQAVLESVGASVTLIGRARERHA